MEINISAIKSSPYQPRMEFSLEDIRGSVEKDGIASPIIVRKVNEHYELIDGERRTRLAKELGHQTINASVIEADEDKAMRLVWRLNVERKDYTPKEKAYHFKKMQEQGLSLRGIGRIFGYGYDDVLMYLNVFKLPPEYQEAVWNRNIPISHVRELRRLFNGGATGVAPVLSFLDQKLSSEQLREALNPTLAKFKEAQIEKAQEAVGEITPEVKLETPEDYAKAAATLKAKAKKLADELLTPERRAELEVKRETDAESKVEKLEEKKREKEEADRKREEKLRKVVIINLKKDKQFIKEALQEMPNEDKAEFLEITPIPTQEKTPKSLKDELLEILKTSNRLINQIERLKSNPEFPKLNLQSFATEIVLLANAFSDLSKSVTGGE